MEQPGCTFTFRARKVAAEVLLFLAVQGGVSCLVATHDAVLSTAMSNKTVDCRCSMPDTLLSHLDGSCSLAA